MSAESNFRQSFANWNSTRTAPAGGGGAGATPALADWTDYVRSGASNLYSQLPSYATDTAASEEPAWFQLSRVEKVIGFGACLAASVLCFTLCIFMFPLLAVQPKKFALIWTMGSLLFVISFGVLSGPVSYCKHLLSSHRVAFTAIYFGSVLATLWSAIIAKSTIMTVLCSIVELVAVAYYLLSYFPFGASAVTFFTSYVMGYLGGFIGAIF